MRRTVLLPVILLGRKEFHYAEHDLHITFFVQGMYETLVLNVVLNDEECDATEVR